MSKETKEKFDLLCIKIMLYSKMAILILIMALVLLAVLLFWGAILSSVFK